MIYSYQDAADYLGSKSNRPAPKGNSLRIVRDDSGSISVVYHQTPVVTYHRDGTIQLACDGWATKTTAAVMERYVPGLRVQVRRMAAGIDSVIARTAVKRGAETIGANRNGRGDTLSFTRGDVRTLADEYDITLLDREGFQKLTDAPDLELYPCTCKMCKGGFDNWQQMAAAATR